MAGELARFNGRMSLILFGINLNATWTASWVWSW